jgi:Histidine kinase-like ATPase domain
MNAHWEQRPPPDVAPGASWRGSPHTAAELTALRGQLHTALRDGPLATGADADAVEKVLLAFEELASNGLRHGRPPVHVTVTSTGAGWLLEVSDAADDRPPTPAVGRDAAHGGLGLYLVARLCPAHGWIPRHGRKHVWAHVVPADSADTAADAG